jgi:hypothetical protein
MVALSDLVLLARSAAGRVGGVAGNTITIALATLARGLQNAGTVNIDATGAGPTNVIIQNSTSGQVANLAVDGDIANNGDIGFASGTNFIGVFRHAITAARDWTFPDATGNVALNSVNNAFSATQSVTGAVNASSTVSVQNNGSTQSITFTGSPTANRVVTFPDADITIGAGSGYLGSLTRTAILAIAPSGFAWAFCNDIGGSGGGTTGVPVYFTPIDNLWLRYATDTAI